MSIEDNIEQGLEDFELEEVTEPEPQTASIIVPSEIIRLINLAPSGQIILSTCIDLAVFLAQKNLSYGNSFLNPARVFSTADRVEQILVRIDDKISRIQNRQDFEGDDDIKDLLGYLLLYFVVKSQEAQSEQSNSTPTRTP